jgi:alkylhydroperoxidase family enzyme
MTTTWFPERVEGRTLLDQVAGLRPAYAQALREVEAAVWAQDQVEPELLELCRLRIAQMLGADAATNAPPVSVAPDAALVAQLRQWPTSDGFSERQRVALGFAEQLVVDAQGVGDEQAAQVIAALGDGGFLVLTYACGFFETTQRASILLGDGVSEAGKPS